MQNMSNDYGISKRLGIQTACAIALIFTAGRNGVAQAVAPEEEACLQHVSESWSIAARKVAETDCKFYAENLVNGADSWTKYADENVVTSFAMGRDNLRKAINGMYSRPSFKLEWYPESAEERSGFVVTSGRSVRSWLLPDGSRKVIRGHYLTVWHRQDDGLYKFVYDVGEDDAS